MAFFGAVSPASQESQSALTLFFAYHIGPGHGSRTVLKTAAAAVPAVRRARRWAPRRPRRSPGRPPAWPARRAAAPPCSLSLPLIRSPLSMITDSVRTILAGKHGPQNLDGRQSDIGSVSAAPEGCRTGKSHAPLGTKGKSSGAGPELWERANYPLLDGYPAAVGAGGSFG